MLRNWEGFRHGAAKGCLLWRSGRRTHDYKVSKEDRMQGGWEVGWDISEGAFLGVKNGLISGEWVLTYRRLPVRHTP